MLIVLTAAMLAAAPSARQPAPVSAPQSDADRPTAGYYFVMGRVLEQENHIDEAIDALKHAIALEPAAAEPRAELAALYARQDRAREALDAAEDAVKVDPQNVEGNHILGSVLAALAEQHQAGRPGEDPAAYPKRAIAALEIARRDGAGDLAIDLTLARLYLQQEQPARAVPLLRRIVDEQPGYAEGFLLLADAQEAAGHPDDAVESLTTVLAQQPTLLRARVQLAEVYERRHKWLDAAASWAQAQALNAANVEVVARRAAALINGGKPADAGAVLADALKTHPDEVRLSYMLAQAQREAGDLGAAEATARALRTAHPDDVRGLYVLTQILEATDRDAEVVDLLQPEIARLRTNAAGSATAVSQLALLLGTEGLALQQLHRNDAAIAAFKEAADRAPDDPSRQAMLIQGYTSAGRLDEALAAAEAARRKFPEDTSILYQLGAAQDRAGRQPDAERSFRDLLAHDPLDANALNYVGYMLAEQGTRLTDAVDFIQRALKVEPDNPSFLDSLGWAYMKQGRLDLADPALTTAATKLPKNSVIQEHLGDLRLKQHRATEAVDAWQRALAGDGDSIDRAKIQKKINDASRNR